MNTQLLSPFCSPTKKSNTNLLFNACLVLLFGISSLGLNAQVSSYTPGGTTVTPAYSTITTGTSLFGLSWDDSVIAINFTPSLDFSFNFNGKVYTSCYVSTNGFITFGSAPSPTEYNPISGTGTYDGAIAVYGRNLVSNNSAIQYIVQGTAPNRTATVQYSALRATGSTNAGTYNMQIILHESDPANVTDPGKIELRYNTVALNAAAITNLPGQIGLRGEKNHDFNNRKFNLTSGNWTSPTLPRGTLNTDFANTRTATSTINKVYNFTYDPPTCFAPRLVTVTPISVTNNSVSFTWTAPNPAPSGGYDYLVSTTAPTNINITYPIVGTVATGSVAAGITSASASGLTASTQYYVYVRSNCGTPSGWSAAAAFTTRCPPYTVNPPWVQDFNTATIGSIPTCNYSETLNPIVTSNYWQVSGPTAPTWGFPTRHIQILVAGGEDNDASYFTEGLVLTGGQRYRLQYTYGGSSFVTSSSQNLIIRYGTAPLEAAMTNVLADHPAFKGGPYLEVINFIPPTTGTYYIGFTDYTFANNETTLLDDIRIEESTCIMPTAINHGTASSGSVGLNWAAAVPAPANGYYYYVSTSPTPPTDTTIPTGSVGAGITSVVVNGLSPSTTYYIWIASNCGNGDHSQWNGFVNVGTTPNATFTTLAGSAPTTCNPSGAANAQDPNGITNVTIGTINNNTLIEANNYGDYSSQVTSVAQGAVVPFSVTYRTGYTYNTQIWVDWNRDGDFVDAGELMYTGVSGSASPTTLPGTITIPGSPTTTVGLQYRMRIGGIDDPIFTGGALTPCRIGAYQAFEDYSLFVTLPPPPITLSGVSPSATICSGSSATVSVTSTLSNYNTYTWSPATGVSGTPSLYTFNPTATTTYTLTGVNTTTFQTTKASVTIIVNPTPTAVTVTPATSTVCEGAGPAQALTITPTSGIISGVSIYSENFNGTAPGWTTTNTTTGAIPASENATAVWALQPDGYNPFLADIHSNDNSQFAFCESDAPGITASVNTTLTSPAINLTGYTAATLSFWQFYKWYAGTICAEAGTVQIGSSPTGTFTDIPSGTYGVSGDVGTATSFVNSTLDLTPYISMGTVYIRFKYVACWDWGWGIDNVSVTGSGVSAITWSPTAGLYTDAAHTTPYTGTNLTTVYALPTTTTIYTATATSASGCPTTGTTTVNVTPLNATISPSSMSVCSGVVPSITLSSYAGTISKWQYSTSNSPYVWNDFPSSNSPTLTSAQITAQLGVVKQTYYFQAVLTGCATATSNVLTITVPLSTWNGSWTPSAPTASTMAIFNANANIISTFNACSCQVQAGTVNVAGGVTMIVQNGVNVNNAAALNFANNASLVQVNNSANSGDIHYSRNTTPMRKFDYTYWSSPVNTQILAKLSPNTQPDKYYWFNTTTYQWTSVAAPGITPMDVGKGYIIRGPNSFSDTVPAIFSTYFGYDGVTHGGGTPNNGDYTVSVVRNSVANQLNCLGNPYPSAISGSALMSDSSNTASLGTGTTLYFWTHNTPITGYQYASNDYASYNYLGGTGTAAAGSNPCSGCNSAIPNGNIAAGQGFMVKVTNTGNVTFKNSMRLTGLNNQFFRTDGGSADPTENIERHRMWIELSNSEGAFKQMLVGYAENATNGIDNGFDGDLVESGNPVSLYSILDNTKLTIQGRALPFDVNDQVPVGYRSAMAGTFEIKLAVTDGLFDSQEVYLEDTVLNVIHNLKTGPYSFVTEAGSFDSRFIIRYTNTTLATDNPVFSENGVVVYKNNGTIFVKTSNIVMDKISVFDVRGRKIFNKNGINGTETEIRNLNAAQQVLLVQITSVDNVTVTKKIIF